MWRKFTVYGLRFSKTSFWNRINTGFLDPAVATVLTACGIETFDSRWCLGRTMVATVLTACGIETFCDLRLSLGTTAVATVLTACGIETGRLKSLLQFKFTVATVLTACGIETNLNFHIIGVSEFALQQCLPLAVLKLQFLLLLRRDVRGLQQCLPLAVLKPLIGAIECAEFNSCNSAYRLRYWNFLLPRDVCKLKIVATVLTACGIETHPDCFFERIIYMLQQCLPLAVLKPSDIPVSILPSNCCNSAYRLRYWNSP